MYLSDAALDIIGSLPLELLWCWMYTRLLDMRRPGVFFAVRGICIALFLLVRSFGGAPVRMVALVLCYIALPLAFSRGSLVRRALVVLAVIALSIFPEFLGYIAWYGLTASPVFDYDAARAHLGAFFAVHTLLLLVYWLLYFLLRAVFRRGTQVVYGRSSLVFVGFLALQLVFAALVIWSKMLLLNSYDALDWVGALFCIVSFAVDLVLVVDFERNAQRELASARADAANELLDEYLMRYGDALGEVERTARIRHDLRNQLQVVDSLIERGQREEAAEHLDRMLAALEAPAPSVAGETS